MHFSFNCFKPDPCTFHFVEIFYLVGILCENKTIKSKNDGFIKMVTQSKQFPLKVSNRNTKRRWEKCSESTIKIPEKRHSPCSDVFIVNCTYFTHYSSVSIVKCGQNLLINSIWSHTITTLWVDQWEFLRRSLLQTLIMAEMMQSHSK